jgi:Gnt-I system low-affinity gluconate transporter
MIASIAGFVGHPFIALTLATLGCFLLLGTGRGYTRQQVHDIANKAMESAGIVILLTGAGGVLKQTMINSGAGEVIANHLAATPLPPILLAFLLAAVVRVAQGSATVSMIIAAGLMGPILAQAELSATTLALIVIAIASSATVLSHVNDSGFWLVNRHLGLTAADTLRSWTVMSTLI